MSVDKKKNKNTLTPVVIVEKLTKPLTAYSFSHVKLAYTIKSCTILLCLAVKRAHSFLAGKSVSC